MWKGTQDHLGASTGVGFGGGTGNGGFRIASGSLGVAWTHGMAWARLTPMKAGVIGDLICSGFCDGSRESVNEIVSEIGHRTRRVW